MIEHNDRNSSRAVSNRCERKRKRIEFARMSSMRFAERDGRDNGHVQALANTFVTIICNETAS